MLQRIWVLNMMISERKLDGFFSGELGDPHSALGAHPTEKGDAVVVRVFLPKAERVEVFDQQSARTFPLKKIDDRGFFEGAIPKEGEAFNYLLRSFGPAGDREFLDPYSFLPTTTNEHLAGFNKGTESQPQRILGSICREFSGQTGVSFVIWAPYAKRVFLVGEFNDWSTSSLPMRPLGPSGCWELFVPYAFAGQQYKFHLLGADGVWVTKADPFAAYSESPPGNASLIFDSSVLQAVDIARNASQDVYVQPLSVYEVHLGSWRHTDSGDRPMSYLELTETLPAYVRDLGFSHIEFLPPAQHPYGGSWGYQVTGFYAPVSRLGSPEEFSGLVAACHAAGIGVILDWVPGHFPTDDFGLARFDGSCLFEHEDPRKGFHADWGTLVFNYGRPEVRSFLLGSAFSWIERYGVDGFRVDAVASMLYLDYSRDKGEWLPNEKGGRENLEAIDFIRQFHEILRNEYPGVVSIAEESTAFPGISEPTSQGGLGFDFKWNMGWMHDVLAYLGASQKERPAFHDKLTFGSTYQFSEKFVQVFSHDEVVHGKGSLANKMKAPSRTEQISQLRALYAFLWTWPGKKTLFMGGEFAQWKEWDCDAELDWSLRDFPLHEGVRNLVRELNSLYREHPSWAVCDHQRDKFQWISCDDAQSRSISFLRFGEMPADTLLVACNFSDEAKNLRLGCPSSGNWRVILNSADIRYGGEENDEIDELFAAESKECNSFPLSLRLNIPAYSVLVLTPESA